MPHSFSREPGCTGLAQVVPFTATGIPFKQIDAQVQAERRTKSLLLRTVHPSNLLA